MVDFFFVKNFGLFYSQEIAKASWCWADMFILGCRSWS